MALNAIVSPTLHGGSDAVGLSMVTLGGALATDTVRLVVRGGAWPSETCSPTSTSPTAV